MAACSPPEPAPRPRSAERTGEAGPPTGVPQAEPAADRPAAATLAAWAARGAPPADPQAGEDFRRLVTLVGRVLADLHAVGAVDEPPADGRSETVDILR